MSTFYDDVPKIPGIRGDYAKIAYVDDVEPKRVLIRAVDAVAEEAVSLAFSLDQARVLAAAIVAAADQAEADQ